MAWFVRRRRQEFRVVSCHPARLRVLGENMIAYSLEKLSVREGNTHDLRTCVFHGMGLREIGNLEVRAKWWLGHPLLRAPSGNPRRIETW